MKTNAIVLKNLPSCPLFAKEGKLSFEPLLRMTYLSI